eukprot:3453270-Rhodomonas_salina.3
MRKAWVGGYEGVAEVSLEVPPPLYRTRSVPDMAVPDMAYGIADFTCSRSLSRKTWWQHSLRQYRTSHSERVAA